MNILTVSDKVEKRIYSSSIKNRFSDVDLVISCGDLPYYYVEFLGDALKVPVLFVRGNHAPDEEFSESGTRTKPEGAINLHRQIVDIDGILIGGFEGSLYYNCNHFQYTQIQMWGMVLAMLPRLILNKLFHGRFLDILVTHAPPWGINDQPDRPHQGFKALRWLLDFAHPAYHFHGHTFSFLGTGGMERVYRRTKVINTHGFRKTSIIINKLGQISANGKHDI